MKLNKKLIAIEYDPNFKIYIYPNDNKDTINFIINYNQV